MVQFLSKNFFYWISSIFVGFFKSSLFCVSFFIYVCVYMCVCVCMYVCMYVCLYIYVCKINLVKPSGLFTYHRVLHLEILHGARFALSVLYGSQNRQRLLLYTLLPVWFL